ncbi:MAG TPA: glycosyltransferase, exosortase A system-associated [Chromatiaceae bacterium]|jgi:PEP-CTERM/exosortase A-associated glycosyltransferase|nr:glycosyltransferase, exosortase A system-associated [Chromatiaceae bacterium]HIN81793.1 glycosyltransferase, exosortase A system-associated [Chromatiales bacterium]HIA08783.1 glycosyltransferase, exosortase A system-associated [Chromatiaceae bacterium]HIB84540.1 glycosyltransferase, exosortase A system-associated [Chromatiaceae bacterium]HIO13612.1 glycosyltransferase, exosortase A system-associated [Chromatiales bacterium]
MKILHVLDHSIPLHSGYTFRTRAILEQQRAMGWKTEHITSAKHVDGCALEEEIDGLHFYRTPPSRNPLAKLPVFDQISIVNGLTRRLQQVVDKEKPDILHAHSPALNGIAALRVGRMFDIPVVYEVRAFWEDAAVDHGTSTEWGLRYRATRALESSVLQRAAAVTTICEGLRGDMIHRDLPADKITVIPNAVNLENFQPGGEADSALLQELGLEGKTILGFIGSFYAYEGLDLLIEALPLLHKQRDDIRLLLVGGGPEDQRLKALVHDMGLGEQVIFTGRVPHNNVQRYYDLVDIFVYPRHSMRLTELVTPLKPLEAMAQGRLVLASDVGGHKELIEHGQNGDLFAADDPEALAQAALLMLDQQSRWPERRVEARRFVEAERNWPLSCRRYDVVYKIALERRYG